MSTNFVYGSGNPQYVEPKTSQSSQTLSPELMQFYKDLGLDPSQIPSIGGDNNEPLKSGVFTRTETSRKIPDDLAIVDNINNVFQQLYKRDATQEELAIWLPALRSKYKSKDGTSKTTIKYTYKNGELVNTDYFTADNQDPKVWLEDQVKTKLLAGAEETVQVGMPEGPIGQNFVQVKNFASRNGIMLSDDAASDYATQIVTGKMDQNTVFNSIRESAISAFPQLADRIKSGIDVKTIADPYIQSMSNILEIPYTSVDLFDPKIRSALSYTLPDGKVATKSIYDFERELREDPRWQYTKNAKKTVAESTLRVLQDFGFQG
jgi:hypothetical protein